MKCLTKREFIFSSIILLACTTLFAVGCDDDDDDDGNPTDDELYDLASVELGQNSSAKVELCLHSNRRNCSSYGPGEYNAHHIVNDSISSIYVPASMKVTVFKHHNFENGNSRGDNRVLEPGSYSNLASMKFADNVTTMNDSISSVRIIYSDCKFDDHCEEGYFCKKNDYDCNGPGSCTKKVQGGIVLHYWAPLCTCKGGTISNHTYDRNANIDYDGMCRATGQTPDDWNLIMLKNRNSGKCLDVAGSSHEKGANVIQYNCNRTTNQLWRVSYWGTRNAKKYYKIINHESGQSLDVAGSSRDNGGNVAQWTYGPTTNQLWEIIESESEHGGFDRTYQLKPMHSEKCLDVEDASKSDSANVQQYSCHSGNNQKWSAVDMD